MVASGLALSRSKQMVRQLLAIVDQHLVALDLTGLAQDIEKGTRTGRARVDLASHQPPARGAVYGH